MVHGGLISLDGGAAEDSQDEIDAAWRDEVADRLDEVLNGTLELGSFEATGARFVAKYPSVQ